MKRKVMVIEDEPFTAMALELDLRRAGHDVLGPAGTVAEARRLLQQGLPDLVLIDINLQGGGDAIGLACEMTQGGVATLFVTGQAATARRHAYAALGLIAKPYDGRVVLRAIEYLARLQHGGVADDRPAGLELFDAPRWRAASETSGDPQPGPKPVMRSGIGAGSGFLPHAPH
jgi:DNA-binding response OmpR family regulator